MPSPHSKLARAVWRPPGSAVLARSRMAWLRDIWNRLMEPHPAALGRAPLGRDMVERWRLRNGVFLLLSLLSLGAVVLFVALGSRLVLVAIASPIANLVGYTLSRRGYRHAAGLLVILFALGSILCSIVSIGRGIFEAAFCIPSCLAFILFEPFDRKARLAAIGLTIAAAMASVVPWFAPPLAPAAADVELLRASVLALTLGSSALILWQFIGNRLRTVDSLEHALADAEADRSAEQLRVVGLDHDLRTPLQGMLGMLAVLERTALTAEQRDFLRIAQESGDALVKVLRKIAAEPGEVTDKIFTAELFELSAGVSMQPVRQARAPSDERSLSVSGDAPPARRASSSGTGDFGRMSDTGPLTARVLVVEDNAINQKVAARMLEGLGCEVEIAEHGEEALDRLTKQGQSYDLVFMDIQMPVMDGIAATQAIRAHEASAGGRTPIVAMTAHALDADRQRCLSAGMDGYITKPIKPSELKEILRRHVPLLAMRTQTGSSPSSAE